MKPGELNKELLDRYIRRYCSEVIDKFRLIDYNNRIFEKGGFVLTFETTISFDEFMKLYKKYNIYSFKILEDKIIFTKYFSRYRCFNLYLNYNKEDYIFNKKMLSPKHQYYFDEYNKLYTDEC